MIYTFLHIYNYLNDGIFYFFLFNCFLPCNIPYEHLIFLSII